MRRRIGSLLGGVLDHRLPKNLLIGESTACIPIHTDLPCIIKPGRCLVVGAMTSALALQSA